ncbi:MAG: transporter substrate-binding domain-containing protein [Desulfovibrio sp.]|jgi:cyclohexadienyl dehydratase|nr:transporter substrate-binding domain-containing protein [Desulfovibrio sp.]
MATLRRTLAGLVLALCAFSFACRPAAVPQDRHLSPAAGQASQLSQIGQRAALQDDGSLRAVKDRGVLRVGTTGDYRPLSFREPATGAWWGFDLDVAAEIARRLGVGVAFEPTSWPTLTADVMEGSRFDLAMGGITATQARKEKMLMSEGYLANGKTLLCRREDRRRFRKLEDLDRPGVRVMVNPGGLNEQFARRHLTHAQIIVHPKNEEIPRLVAEGRADAMVTEITEAPWYVKSDPRLAAPLLDRPFTRGEIAVLLPKGRESLLGEVNRIIASMKADGTLRRLHAKYGLACAWQVPEK